MFGISLALAMLASTPELPASATRTVTGAEARVTIRNGGAAGGARPAMGAAVAIAAKWGAITSVHRSPEHNRAVGGAPNSLHLQGRAIDIARRPGVRHAQIEDAFRRAGYVLLESLDEGDHSHFAFGVPGQRQAPVIAARVQLAAASPARSCAAAAAPSGRRRPDRAESCPDQTESAPALKPVPVDY